MAHPGWTELTTVKKTTIEVAGVEVEIKIDIPISAMFVCDDCGDSIGVNVEYDSEGDPIIYIEKCKCEEA